jgi:pectate lyase-like protein
MNIVAPLASGIVGAPNGTATIYKRGTATRATWYDSFEGTGQSSTANVTLDANGGAEVYVNEYVDVTVNDNTGASVRSFTAGEAAANVEVRSTSFTGIDYTTALSAAGNPIDLKSVLDLWKTSAGTTDFKVLVAGVATLLKDAVAGRQFYNVKDAAYGALGDSSTNDTTAIQAAINAAHAAGGGIVYFPAGTYRITAALTWYRDVSFIGIASNICVITMDHASNDMFTADSAVSNSATFVMGLAFTHQQACTGVVFDLTSNAREHIFISCRLGGGGNTRGLVFSGTGQQSVVKTYGCQYSTRTAMALVAIFEAANCTFTLASVSSLTASVIKVETAAFINGCQFFTSGATASTLTVIEYPSSTYGSVVGCRFNSFGATTTGICVSHAGTELSVTGCTFGAKGSATAATAMSIGTGNSFSESGNVFNSTTSALLPDMTPYAYTASVSGGIQRLDTRESLMTTATQSGGGTKTVSGDIYGIIQLTISDNTGFTLQITKAPVGAMVTLALYSSGGAGTGAITWGNTVYGNPGGGFTIATTKVRFYSFRSQLVNATHAWCIVGTTFGDL